MLDMDRMRAFVLFAKHLNFTHAARVLHISQPALHAQIGKLASELDVTLYRRVGRGLQLTDDGVRVARFGREMMERVGAFMDELSGADEHAKRPVILAAGRGAYLYLLGDAIEGHVRHERAPLRLITADRSAALQAVRHGTAHIAVATLDTRPDDLQLTLLASVPQVLVVPEAHPLARGRDAALQDLDGLPLIVPPANRPHRHALEAAWTRAGVSFVVAVEASGWELMLHFARLGLGYAVVNGCCRIPPGLVAVPLAQLARQNYYIIRRQGSLPTAAESLFQRLRTHATTAP